MFQAIDSHQKTEADRAAAMLRSGALGRRILNLAQLAAAAHRMQVAEQIVRTPQASAAPAGSSTSSADGAAA